MQDSAGIRNALDEALIEDNSYSIVEINNDVYSVSKPAIMGHLSK